MSIIKSFSVGLGDMFYIKHGSDNFTVIDCCLSDDNKKEIVDEIKEEKRNKEITRFISTHPDGDHIQQLDYFDDEIDIVNFYCVENEATKSTETNSFKRYCDLRDSSKAFNIYKGCKRKWMNDDGPDKNGKEIGSSGINILWPNTSNEDYKTELEKAKEGTAFNNISCIIEYSLKNGVTAVWMGDLETDFMEKINDKVSFSKTNILFAPHHGRKSGKIPQEWLDSMNPDIIVMGEAHSNDSDYSSYPNHNKIRQNSAKDITFECDTNGKIHIYSSNENYSVDFLTNENKNSFDYYIGTLNV
jgi:beta-lactamase superfamily II metal-dependent hydrolase